MTTTNYVVASADMILLKWPASAEAGYYEVWYENGYKMVETKLNNETAKNIAEPTAKASVLKPGALIYLGQNIPGGVLMYGAVYSDYPPSYGALLEEYPDIKRLFVNVLQTAHVKGEIAKQGTEANCLYQNAL